MMMSWRVRYEVMGGHVDCRLFCAPSGNRTFAFCGKFKIRAAELPDFQQAFAGAEFIEDVNVPAKEAV